MLLPFALPAVCRKKITAAFDGGPLSSDGGVFLLAAADKRVGLLDTLARLVPDHWDPARITHEMTDILRARVFAIATGLFNASVLARLSLNYHTWGGKRSCCEESRFSTWPISDP
jgi:hypothetical protein